jgi:hypothetical protein
MGIFVNKMVDADVDAKVDTDYVSTQLPDIPNLAVTFICTDDDRFAGGDEWISPQDGVRHIVIKLPYKLVKRRRDIRPMMVEKVMERLGKRLI